MSSIPPLRFKIATEESEFEQIHHLNYRTFVEEIPQHGPNPARALVDRFDKENTYVVCLRGERLLGMIAVRGKRPFSLDQKLENLDAYLPKDRSVCEVRLLSVERPHRNGVIFRGLLGLLVQYCKRQGYDLAVISGAVGQLKLYEHLGFVPFGPRVGTPDALFQPMYLTREVLEDRPKRLHRVLATPVIARPALNLLPGPVGTSQAVRQAVAELPVSHRSEGFVEDFRRAKRLLCQMVGAHHVEILLGSGTLANDAIAAQVSLGAGPGLILSNGEFGDRLLDHAARFGLSHEVLRVEWGETFARDAIVHRIERTPGITWVWVVHCETSTGVLNDLATVSAICAQRDIRLCVDCISSIGTVPVDLRGISLASGVSGKGLGAFPGLAMVFYNQKIPPAPKRLPRYLDLGLYAVNQGIPFTHSSNLLRALLTALERFEPGRRFQESAELCSWLRSKLRELDFEIVAPDAHASPAVITIALPNLMHSEQVGRHLEELGYLLSYRSGYLLKRNWIQICLMGQCSREELVPVVAVLRDLQERAGTGTGG